MPARFVPLLAAGSLALAATAASPALVAAAKGKPKLDACKLLTKAEVAAAIGEPVASVKGGGSSTGARFCNWTGKDSHLLSKGISLIAARDHAKERYAKYRKQLHATKPVKGLGDAAATDGQVIIARVGNRRFLFISPLYADTGIGVATLKPLAKKALARLK